MLSIVKPQPSDPHEISLKGVDLSIPPLDEHNPIPKFSIRDYVFNARSKDIETNWPFSLKSLQLCLKHGVKDLLPPFQCLDCVKNRSNDSGGVESTSSGEGTLRYSVREPSNPSNDHVYSSPNEVVNMGSSVFESDKRLPFTTNNQPCEEGSIKTFEKPELHFLPKKTDMPKPSSMKKCKLILKVRTSGAESSSSLNTASATIEQMAASKVCPVCKTFSSSSNTTLNAHIDQCLSMDSPIDPSSKSKVIKHRIKPRKTRLMVDIYATAQYCTLEELDRRNGRIWSEKPILLPTQETAVECGEEKRQKANFEGKNDDTVYIDANGTKLRILNKISDTSSVSKLGVNPHRLSKALKGGKGSKLLSTCKKKQKHRKYLKLASQREKQCSYKTRLASRVLEDQGKDLPTVGCPKTDEIMDTNVASSSKSREQIKAHHSGAIMAKWASSKRTGLLKKRLHIDQSSLRDSYLERSYSEKELAILQKGKRVGDFSFENPINECHEQPPLKKRMGFKSFGARSSTSLDGTLSSKVTKFSSSRERMSSVYQSSLRQPKLSKKIQFRVKNVVSRAYNEKHLEHQHGVHEDSGQLHLKRSNILKIKKKKSPTIISPRNESTEDHGNREIYSSPRANADVEDGFVAVEQPQGGEIIIGRSSGANSGNVMNLAKSFDQDFYTIGDTDMDMVMEMCPTNVQGNFFSGVDPITIPGPPGSFLPSPGRMSLGEDNQENSSLTTSPVHSSIDHLDHLDMVDRHSSNSPKSANSAVSNTLVTKSDSKSIEDLSYNPRAPQDEIIKLGFSDEITKSTLGFQDDQPCCCSRKEVFAENIEESLLLRRRVMSSSPLPEVEKSSSFYPNERSKDMISLGNSSYYPISMSGVGPVSVQVPIKPPVYGDFGSPSPSSPNPVLRLMGKNLMVVNNDENLNQNPCSKFQAGAQDHVVHQVPPFYSYKVMDFDLHECKPCFVGLPNDLNRLRNGPFSPLRNSNKIDRVEKTSGTMQRNEGSIIPEHTKEVIIIDDTPENEIRTSSDDISVPMAGYYNQSHLNPFYGYQGSDFSPYRGPHMIPNSSSQLPPPSSGLVRWNNVLEGSGILSSSSTNRARSSLYYSPSMS